eukprot:RCo046940
MALQYLDEGKTGFPSRSRRTVALETFVNHFVIRFALRDIPEGDFCPNRCVTVIRGFLHQVSHSIPLIRLRIKSVIASTRRLQAAARKWLGARDLNIQLVLEHWTTTHATQKKAMQAELYRDSKLCQASLKVRLRAYTKLHNSEGAMHAAVVELYWERRKQFQRKFRTWHREVTAIEEEVELLREFLEEVKGEALEVPGHPRPRKRSCFL